MDKKTPSRHRFARTCDGAHLRRQFLRRLGPAARTFVDMVDALPQIGFHITDARGRLIFINRKNLELCNIPPGTEVAGRNYRDFFPEVLSAAYDEFDQNVRATGAASQNKIVFCQPNGTTLPIVLSNYVLRDMRGRVIGTMGVYYQANEDWSVEWVSPVKAAVDHIHAHFAEEITADELARLCHVNVNRLRQIFEQNLGVAPMAFLINYRLNQAKQLLEETDMKITDIAQQTGFFDLSHFTKAFRKSRGLTPGAYRRLHRSSRQVGTSRK